MTDLIHLQAQMADADKKDYAKVIKEFEQYCNPKQNVLYERFRFYNRSKELGETFEHYIQELKSLIKSYKDEMLKDRIIFGCSDKHLQEKLLNLKNIELKEVIDTCRNYEITKKQVKVIQNDKVDIPVNAVKAERLK
ncbi:hypothetical protein QE152_g13890 [Popillia japonica]|uniref:Uncharacterized protein n=1 Tax=Popillia japonica TaxID=7064 RepID=A0AAW1LAA1_POPJA